ncbi:unnamed protein product [Durusdinium trenchii]|uniref:Uncharacterized protein n=1 Tax=Durusdinium trenchii TaxID=1381693 RepID=A0ABP0QX78_9DINO
MEGPCLVAPAQVTTAMETTSADKDLAVMKQLQKHQAQVEDRGEDDDLKALFSEISGGERNEEVSIDQLLGLRT